MRRRHFGTSGPHGACDWDLPQYTSIFSVVVVGRSAPRPRFAVCNHLQRFDVRARRQAGGLSWNGRERGSRDGRPEWEASRRRTPATHNAASRVRQGMRRCALPIGARGFEPRTSCSRSRRANRAALRPVFQRARNVIGPSIFGRPRATTPGSDSRPRARAPNRSPGHPPGAPDRPVRPRGGEAAARARPSASRSSRQSQERGRMALPARPRCSASTQDRTRSHAPPSSTVSDRPASRR